MPSYTFYCNDCGEFTLFFQSMSGNRERAHCPACEKDSKRVYFAPNLASMPNSLKNRIEKGMEPRKMTRDELNTNPKIRKKPTTNRPWQMGS